MIIVGINGNPGAGKTTVSEILLQDENRKVVHLDHIYDCIKRRIPSDMVTHSTRDDGEKTMFLTQNSLFKLIRCNPILNDVYLSLRNVIGRRITLDIIRKNNEEGIDYLILEGAHLYYFLTPDEIDASIYVTSEDEIRRKRIIKRNTKAEMEANALVGELSYPEGNAMYVINNVGTMDELISTVGDIEVNISQKFNNRY